MGLTKGGAKRLLVPLLLAAVVYAFWSTVFVWPLRLFVVLLHEVSHGLAAVATGGRIVSIELSPAEGGLCTTAGGGPSSSPRPATSGAPSGARSSSFSAFAGGRARTGR